VNIFAIGALISSARNIREHLNALIVKKFIRRDEEVIKFVINRILKYIRHTRLKEADNPLDYFYEEYFFNKLSRNEFDEIFGISKW